MIFQCVDKDSSENIALRNFIYKRKRRQNKKIPGKSGDPDIGLIKRSDVVNRFGLAAADSAVAGVKNGHGLKRIFKGDGLSAFKEFDDLFEEHAVERNPAGDFRELESSGFGMADTGTVFPAGAGHIHHAAASVAVDDMEHISVPVFSGRNCNSTAAHDGLKHFNGVAAVPDHGRTGGSFAHRTPDGGGVGFAPLFDGGAEIGIETQRGRGEETDIVLLGDIHDLEGVFPVVGKGFVEEDGFAQSGAFLKVFEVECGIVDLKHDRIAIAHSFVEITGDFDADALKGFLAFVLPLFTLEGRGETEGAGGDQTFDFLFGGSFGILHQLGQGDGVAGVKTDDCNFEDLAHFQNPFIELLLECLSG